MDASGKEGLAYHRSACFYLNICIHLAGDRHWRCDELAEQIVSRLLERYGPDLVVVHGGAPGVDDAFAAACRELGITAEAHVADWKGLGNVAGLRPTGTCVEACYLDRQVARFLLSSLSPFMSP
jgi:YspA, cpYpsA-related SLOG family